MKKLPNEVKQTLKIEANYFLDKLKDLDNKMQEYSNDFSLESNRVLTAYYLSGIYSCVEDIFEKIAKVFENSIENPAAWHSELLLRMRLEIDKIRPQVISENLYIFLDELRSFRHVFRSSYVFSLDGDRIKSLTEKWSDSKPYLLQEIETFLKRL